MSLPEITSWRHREVITAQKMNSRIGTVHRYLYQPPSARVTGRQAGSDPGSPTPPGTYIPGWIAANVWRSFLFWDPGTGVQPDQEWDTTGGAMLSRAQGIVTRLRAPEDGVYEVVFGGVLDAQASPNNVHFRVGGLRGYEEDWPQAPIYASQVPGHSSAERFVGGINTMLALRAGDTIAAAGICDQPHYLGAQSAPGRTFLSARWIGRYPS